MKNLVHNFVHDLIQSYFVLFKCGATLLGTALLALAMVGPFVYEKDVSANKDKFALEFATGKTLSQIADCRSLDGKLVVDCEVAKYEFKMLDVAVHLLFTVADNARFLGLMLIGLSCMGYFNKLFRSPIQAESDKDSLYKDVR